MHARGTARDRWLPAVVLTAALVAVLFAQVWMVSAGRLRRWYCYTAYYDLLGDAFRHGHTALRLHPDPALLALDDPYDPAQNAPYRLHDALLYRGRYYLYWGPAPGLLLAAVKALCRVQVGDQQLAFAASAGLVLIASLLLEALRRRLYPRLPWWVLVPGVLAAGLANPMPLLLARAAVYEAVIALSQFFLVGGLWAAFTALAGERCDRRRLAVAGAAWALAAATRVSLAPAVALLALLVAGRLWRLHARTAPSVKPFAAALALFVAPLCAAAAALAAYNQVRFGSWHEFGMRYQLAGYNVHAVTHTGVGVLTARFVAPSLYAYLLHPFALAGHFPFVTVAPAVFHGALVHGDPVAGAALAVPYLWLALVPVLLLAGAAVRWRARDETKRLRDWFALCLLAAGLGAIAPTLFVDGCQNRYLADAVPSLLVLASLGAWEGLDRLTDRPVARRAFLGLVTTATVATVAAGILLGAFWQGYTRHQRTRIPSEWYPAKTSLHQAERFPANGPQTRTSFATLP